MYFYYKRLALFKLFIVSIQTIEFLFLIPSALAGLRYPAEAYGEYKMLLPRYHRYLSYGRCIYRTHIHSVRKLLTGLAAAALIA